MSQEQLTALVTGGSRGVGAATSVALAKLGYDVALTFNNKAPRAEKVAEQIKGLGRDAITLGGDMTLESVRESLVERVHGWSPTLNALVLNASGGLEAGKGPDYPMQINHGAQIRLMHAIRPLLVPGSTAAFITSHWAHRFGKVEQLPSYGPIAASKYMGEWGMRAMQSELDADGIRLLVVTGDLIEDTITAKMLGRQAPDLASARRDLTGSPLTSAIMGEAIAQAIADPSLPSGHTVVVGAPLETLEPIRQR